MIRAIYGLRSIVGGTVRIDGTPYEFPAPRRSLKRGVAYFPANRIAEGLALSRPIRENASMTVLDLPSFARFGVLRQGAERATITAIMEQLQLRPANIERSAGPLSGGNRQKVMLGRALTRDLTVFLFDEPSVGIDVGAKLEVYQFMKRLVEAGAAVIVVSSELPEVLALSNRLYVMHNGRIAAELTGADKTEQNVLASFFKNHLTAEVARLRVRHQRSPPLTHPAIGLGKVDRRTDRLPAGPAGGSGRRHVGDRLAVLWRHQHPRHPAQRLVSWPSSPAACC